MLGVHAGVLSTVGRSENVAIGRIPVLTISYLFCGVKMVRATDHSGLSCCEGGRDVDRAGMDGAHFGPSGPSSVRVVTRSTQISVGLIDEGIVGGEVGIAVKRRCYRLDRLKRIGLKMKLKMKEFRWSVVSL